MAYIVADRIKETTTTQGTGAISLLGAVSGYRSFASQLSIGDTCAYAIVSATGLEWEVGIGTYSAANTLTRTTVQSSTNSNAAVNFGAGTKDVFICPTAGSLLDYDPITHKISDTTTIDFNDGSATTLAAGRMWYNGSTGSWNLGMGGGNITQQVGEELFVYGKASATIADSPLQIIYQTGTVGASGVITFGPTVAGITNGDLIIGVATEPIANNGFGRVTSFGVVRGITTNGTAYGETWADGDMIYYNPVTGNPTNIKPVAPNIKVSVGTLIKAGAGGSGSIQVEINHGSVLGGTDSNVQISSPTDGQILKYDGVAQVWENAAASVDLATGATGILPVANGGTGVTTATGTGSVVLSNTPTLVTPKTNSIAAVPVTGTSAGNTLALAASNASTTGAGGNVTITAGSGSGVGAGGNIILQPGAQGTSGGNGTIQAGGTIIQTSGTTVVAIQNTTTDANTVSPTPRISFATDRSGTAYAPYFFRGRLFVPDIGGYGTQICLGHPGGPESSGFWGEGFGRVIGNGGIGIYSGHAPRFWQFQAMCGITVSLGFGPMSTSADVAIGRAAKGVLRIADGTSSSALNTTGGSLSFPSSTTAIATSQNDFILAASAFQRINCTSPSSITGIAPPTGGTHVDGRMIRIYNVGNANLTLSHNSTASTTPANRFWNSTGADIVLSTHQYVELIYDSTDNGRGGAGWRVSSVH